MAGTKQRRDEHANAQRPELRALGVIHGIAVALRGTPLSPNSQTPHAHPPANTPFRALVDLLSETQPTACEVLPMCPNMCYPCLRSIHPKRERESGERSLSDAEALRGFHLR